MKVEEEQTVTIGTPNDEGQANITFSGFVMPMFGMPTGELTIPVTVTKNADGSTSYEGSNVVVSIHLGQMVMNYVASISGTQESDEASPVIVLTLSQASVITSVFAETSELANATLNSHYSTLTGITNVHSNKAMGTSYSLNGIQLTAPSKGISIQRQADGTMR